MIAKIHAQAKYLINHLGDRIQGKIPFGAARSGKWAAVRAEHLKNHPNCGVCGGEKNLQVHHIKAFHLHPDLELDPKNLISLCEAPGKNCHLIFGHLWDFKSFNANVVEDAALWSEKLKNRPYGET
jgi:5-methylcytosine-specific restriction protein A